MAVITEGARSIIARIVAATAPYRCRRLGVNASGIKCSERCASGSVSMPWSGCLGSRGKQWSAQAWVNDLPPLGITLAAAQPDDVLELDELWSFVFRKANQRWVWVALCRRTRQIVAYCMSDRSEASCLQLWRRLPSAYTRCHSFSDFWDTYQHVFAIDRHQSVGKDSGQTNHVERWFNTLR